MGPEFNKYKQTVYEVELYEGNDYEQMIDKYYSDTPLMAFSLGDVVNHQPKRGHESQARSYTVTLIRHLLVDDWPDGKNLHKLMVHLKRS